MNSLIPCAGVGLRRLRFGPSQRTVVQLLGDGLRYSQHTIASPAWLLAYLLGYAKLIDADQPVAVLTGGGTCMTS